MTRFKTKIGPSEVTALNNFHLLTKSRLSLVIFSLIFTIFFAYFYILSKELWILLVGILIGPGFVGLSFGIMNVMVLLMNRSSRIISDDNHVSFQFTDNAITIDSEKPDIKSTTWMTWKMVYKAYETKKYYFLYISNMQSYIIPKSSLVIGDLTLFSKTLKGQLNKNFYRK